MSSARYRILLGIALALAAARFLLMPWLEHQGERRDTLEVLTQRLDRSAGLVEMRETIERQTAALAGELDKIEMRYPLAPSSDEYRIRAQQEIGAIAQESGVAITVFDFITEDQNVAAGLHNVRARVQFIGAMNRIARFHGEIEGRLQNAVVRNLRLDADYPIEVAGDGAMRASMVLEFRYRMPQSAATVAVPGSMP